MFIFLSKITIVPRYGISKKTSWTQKNWFKKASS